MIYDLHSGKLNDLEDAYQSKLSLLILINLFRINKNRA